MSKEGKMRRGERDYNRYRDVDGNLHSEIEADANRVADIEFYLENRPKPLVKEVTKSKGKK
tara:strand:+ start:184 stop:366 length:183 start_codon:yes stop_codon:yes gene_type:complete